MEEGPMRLVAVILCVAFTWDAVAAGNPPNQTPPPIGSREWEALVMLGRSNDRSTRTKLASGLLKMFTNMDNQLAPPSPREVDWVNAEEKNARADPKRFLA